MSKAFSLIEMLVVIATIALLATMLLSAMGLVRSAARNAACMNNLRNVGMAMGTWQSEHRGLCFSATDNQIDGRTYNWLGMVGSIILELGDSTTSLPPAMRCKEIARGSYGYAINHNYTAKVSVRGTRAVPRPAETLVVMDGGWEYNTSVNTYQYLPTFSPNNWRHFYKYNHSSEKRQLDQLDGRMNVLWADLRVGGFRKANTVITVPHSSCRALNPWYPDDYLMGHPGVGGSQTP